MVDFLPIFAIVKRNRNRLKCIEYALEFEPFWNINMTRELIVSLLFILACGGRCSDSRTGFGFQETDGTWKPALGRACR